jgi:RimJ/RimL family protein N-acetyltransferase
MLTDHPRAEYQLAAPAAPGERSVARHGGGLLLVRRMEPADAAGLAALYESLDDDDRYHRFFSLYQPTASVVARMADVCRTGGYGLVAVDDHGGRAEVVGEASYTVGANGNGEFGITIARAWQGWLGPFLLDALVEVAAASGIPELEADVMRENRKMLALVRNRGFVIRGRPDHGIMRVAIAAARPLAA